MTNYQKYKDNYTFKDKLRRANWQIARFILFRPFGLPLFNEWRNKILRLFGAKIGKGSIIHSSSDIFAPWNLEVGTLTCIGPHTIIYNPGKIRLSSKVTISQYSYLCTATHDYNTRAHTLYSREIVIKDYAWVAADAFVGMGVTIGEGAVVGARAVVFKDVEPWTVVGGNPAKKIKERKRIYETEK